MLLYIMIGLQVFLTMVVMPNKRNNKEDIKTGTSSIMESTVPSESDLITMIQRYTDYNYWANQQFAEWLGSASEEDLNREIQSSYSSLKETILHIWSAEYLWLQTVKDESSDHSPARNFDGNKEELLDGWLQASENFSTHVKSMSLAELKAKSPKSRGNGFTEIADMILHCMNHSTYHRGQLITMGRQAGLTDPPRTDYIYYVSLLDD